MQVGDACQKFQSVAQRSRVLVLSSDLARKNIGRRSPHQS